MSAVGSLIGKPQRRKWRGKRTSSIFDLDAFTNSKEVGAEDR